MTRRKKEPLRMLTEEEQNGLERISRAHSEPAAHVAWAKDILAVTDGQSCTKAAQMAGRKSGNAVSHLVERFNREGIASIQPEHGGGPKVKYSAVERDRVLTEARRTPDPEKDGTNTWSLTSLQIRMLLIGTIFRDTTPRNWFYGCLRMALCRCIHPWEVHG